MGMTNNTDAIRKAFEAKTGWEMDDKAVEYEQGFFIEGYQAALADAARREGELVEYIKALAVAHNMSHEPFCDSGYWREEFEAIYNKAIKQSEES